MGAGPLCDAPHKFGLQRRQAHLAALPRSWASSRAQATVDNGKSFVVRSGTPFVVKSQDDAHPFYISTYMTGGAAFNGFGDPEFVDVVPAKPAGVSVRAINPVVIPPEPPQ